MADDSKDGGAQRVEIPLVIGAFEVLLMVQEALAEAGGEQDEPDFSDVVEALRELRSLSERCMAQNGGFEEEDGVCAPGAEDLVDGEAETLAVARSLFLRNDPSGNEGHAPEEIWRLLLDGIGQAEAAVAARQVDALTACVRGGIAAAVMNLHLLRNAQIWARASQGLLSLDEAQVESATVRADLLAFMLDWLNALQEDPDRGYLWDFMRDEGVLGILREQKASYRLMVADIPGLAELVNGASS